MNKPLSTRILTIEDEPLLRQTIVAYLEDSGFSVMEAEDGRVGLEKVRTELPDLVLTDLQMPGVRGLEILETLSKEYPDMPVIVLSGAGGMDDVIQALRLGASDYLTKPIADLGILEHAIRQCLERVRLLRENKLYREELEKANQRLKEQLAILEADEEAGRSVQTRLLPKQGVAFGQYQFHRLMIPSLYLSGDHVDYFRISEQWIGFYIADVSGHGASSAFVTVLLQGLLQQLVTAYKTKGDTTLLEPNRLLAYLAAEIHALALGKYLTMIYGVLDVQNHQLTYSIGGHYPNPILVNQQALFLEGQGFPVGIMKQTTYQNHTRSFKEEDALWLFSDGVMEIMDGRDLKTKEDQLLELVSDRNRSPESIKTALGLASKQVLPDDLTVLRMVRSKGELAG